MPSYNFFGSAPAALPALAPRRPRYNFFGQPERDEEEFRRWYGAYARRLGLSADPDDPRHLYDYRAAWRASAEPDEAGAWPEQFESPGRPEEGRTAQDRDRLGVMSNTIEEADFRRWYEERARSLNLAPNPDDPRHGYDYRAAFLAGAEPGERGHWPSQFEIRSMTPKRRALEGRERYDFFGQPEEDEEESRRFGADLAATGALPTEEAEERLMLPPRAGEEPATNSTLPRIGSELLSGLFSTLGLTTPMIAAGAAGGLRDFFAGERTAVETLFAPLDNPAMRRANEFQQSAGWGHPGGELREQMLAESLGTGATPFEAAVAETAAAGIGLADPTDLLGPVGGALGAGARLLSRLRRPARAAAEAATELPPGIAELFAASQRFGASPQAERAAVARIVDASEEGSATRRLVAYDRELNQVGEFEFFEEADHLRPSVVTTGGRGTGVGRQLYRQAVERTGKPIGESAARTAEGDAFRARLMETDPDLFAGGRQGIGAAEPGLGMPRQPGAPQLPLQEFPGAFSGSRLPFQTNFAERLGLDPDTAGLWEDMLIERLPEVQAQRRAGEITMADLQAPERLATANGLTVRKFLATKPGKIYNAEELAVLDSMVARAGQRIPKLAQAVEAAKAGDLGSLDKARLELAAGIYEHQGLLRASIGSSSETGRALRSRQEFMRALSDCFGSARGWVGGE